LNLDGYGLATPLTRVAAAIQWLLEARGVPHQVVSRPGHVTIEGTPEKKAEIYHVVMNASQQYGPVTVEDLCSPTVTRLKLS